MALKLTPKQDQFCKNIVSGKDGITSYMLAYDCKSKGAASVESTKLLKRDDITERIAELNKPIVNLIQNQIISEREQQIKAIRDRIAVCIAKEDETSLIRYYDMLNKIYALYKESDPVQQTENNISNMTNETLLKLVE
jgi:hypothetical protein